MLSAREIAYRLQLPDDDAERISVVPRPDTDALQARAGTSIDLRLGRWFMSFKQNRSSAISLDGNSDGASAPTPREHFVRFGDAFTLHPGRFVLGATLEWVRLPNTVSAQILGKSSLGRNGLIIETASGVHPAFSGCLTLELANIGEVPLRIFPGMEICQLFFHEIKAGKASSLGSFSGQRKPAVLPVKSDKLLAALVEHED